MWLIVFVFNTSLWAQKEEQTALEKEAKVLFQSKQYQAAAEKYVQAINELKEGTVAEELNYQASVSWALAGNREQAFQYLNRLIKKDYYTDFKTLSNDVRFKSLYDDQRWEELKQQTKRNVSIIKQIIPFYSVVNQRYIDEAMLRRVHLELDARTACMIPYVGKKAWGFVSKEAGNEILIEPLYEQVVSVDEKGAIVLDTTERYGLLKPDGTFLIPSIYFQLFKEGDFYRGITTADDSRSLDGVVIKEVGYESVRDHCLQNDYYDKAGKLLFTEKAHDYVTFIGEDDLAWFRYGKRYRIRNRAGKLVKEFKYTNAGNVFVGLADDLLIYYIADDNKEIAHFVAKNLEEEVQFRVPTQYYPNTEKAVRLDGFGVRGLYQLSANWYGWQPVTDYEMHYSFSDSLGLGEESTTLQGDQFTMTMEPINLDFFSQEEFIVRDYREGGSYLINRMGDTLIPQPVSVGDSMVSFQYGRILKGAEGKLFCFSNNSGERHIYTKEKGLQLDKSWNRPTTKVIPWSEEILKKWKSIPKQDYYSSRRSRKNANFFNIYTMMTSNQDDKKWVPLVTHVVMQKEVTEETEKYTNVIESNTYFLYKNEKGETMLELSGDIVFAGYFSEGVAPATNQDGKLGFINRRGEWVIQPKYNFYWGQLIDYNDFICPTFRGGYAFIPGHGYINKEGKELFYTAE